MSRIIKEIEIEEKKVIALFDIGAYHTYVIETLIKKTPSRHVRKTYTVALGGKKIVVKKIHLVLGKIDGLDFDTEAVPVKDIGRADGYELDAIIGALTMEKWEMKLDPKSGKLDLEGLRRREFTEF